MPAHPLHGYYFYDSTAERRTRIEGLESRALPILHDDQQAQCVDKQGLRAGRPWGERGAQRPPASQAEALSEPSRRLAPTVEERHQDSGRTGAVRQGLGLKRVPAWAVLPAAEMQYRTISIFRIFNTVDILVSHSLHWDQEECARNRSQAPEGILDFLASVRRKLCCVRKERRSSVTGVSDGFVF
jgi:hypothetical protein